MLADTHVGKGGPWRRTSSLARVVVVAVKADAGIDTDATDDVLAVA